MGEGPRNTSARKQPVEAESARSSTAATANDSSSHKADNRTQTKPVSQITGASETPSALTYSSEPQPDQSSRSEKKNAYENESAPPDAKSMQPSVRKTSSEPDEGADQKSAPVKNDQSGLLLRSETVVEKPATEEPPPKTNGPALASSAEKDQSSNIRLEMLARGDNDAGESEKNKLSKATTEQTKAVEHGIRAIVDADRSRETRSELISRYERKSQETVAWKAVDEGKPIVRDPQEIVVRNAASEGVIAQPSEQTPTRAASAPPEKGLPTAGFSSSAPLKIHYSPPSAPGPLAGAIPKAYAQAGSIPVFSEPTEPKASLARLASQPSDMSSAAAPSQASGALATPVVETQSPDDYAGKLAAALNLSPQGKQSDAIQSSEGALQVRNLQSEGIFGISQGGRNLSAVDFAKQKQFEYGMEQKPFSADAFLQETEKAIYNTLNSGQSTTVAKSLLQAAEAVNSYRNLIAKGSDSQPDSQAAPPPVARAVAPDKRVESP
jgi:hypothetical protein